MNQTNMRAAESRPAQPYGMPAQPHGGAEYGEAGDPGDTGGQEQGAERRESARGPGTGGNYSTSLQARSGAQGQVSGRRGRQEREATAMLPPVDIYEDEGGVTLLADLPGVTREGLNVRVDGDNLLIEGTAAVPQTGEMELVHGEVLSPHYRRSFTLSRDLDPDKIEASLQQGVLRLRIHKAEQAKPRRIEVRAG